MPASLRGLHAWFPKFSPHLLGPQAIDRDPYGVLRYGDGDNLTAKQAEQIINGLRQLAAFDPYFRKDWWQSISLKGLTHPELIDELRAIIQDISEPLHLRSLILEAINGSNVAHTLQPELKEIMFDVTRIYPERYEAGEAISRIENISIDWPKTFEHLIGMGDEGSTHLVIKLLEKIGFDQVSDDLVARTVITDTCILLPEQEDEGRRIIGSLYRLARKLPINRVRYVLDALLMIVSQHSNSDDWWEKNNYNQEWTEFAQFADQLIFRQLEFDSSSVSPQQLWDWLRMLVSIRDLDQNDRQRISEFIRNDHRLRQGVQRLALFAPSTEEKLNLLSYYLGQLCRGLALTDEDSRIYLSELVDRANPAERNRWMVFVASFRENGLIPKDIRKIARPYAKGDQELKNFLTKKPKLAEWEKKHRREIRTQERNKQKIFAKARKNYAANIEDVKCGEFRWIFGPSRAFLGMYNDLKQEEPDERIVEWLGEEVRDAVLIGFEAVLHRDDLPTTKRIAESYAESRVWNFVFPMLSGAGVRYMEGCGFADLPDELVSSLAIAVEHELLSDRETFDGLKEELESQLRREPAIYEAYLRQKFEPMLEAGRDYITGLYQFARQDIERPLSTHLSLEWLENFPDLPLVIEQELAGCIVHVSEVGRDGAWKKLAKIAKKRLEKNDSGSDGEMYWRSIQFLLDFDAAIRDIPPVTPENRNWLWSVSNSFYYRYDNESRLVPVSIRQLQWIVSTFRAVWPFVERPNAGTSGSTNPWDATQLLQWATNQIAKDPSDEAKHALADLRDMSRDGYTAAIQASIADQHRTHLEAKFRSPSLTELKAILKNEPPQSAADVQAIVLDELAELNQRLRGDTLDLVNNFYDDTGEPRTENECSNQMLIALRPLPTEIQLLPEVAMPQGKRSDAAFVYGGVAVPLEAKGQWHNEVWTAAYTQLDRYYSTEYKSASKGIYVVFWFGPDVPDNKKLKSPPDKAPKPKTAEEMRLALQASLPMERRGDITIVVLDLTRS